MMAGHLLLALCFAATSFLFFEASGALKAFGAVTFVAGFAFFLLEVFVAAPAGVRVLDPHRRLPADVDHRRALIDALTATG